MDQIQIREELKRKLRNTYLSEQEMKGKPKKKPPMSSQRSKRGTKSTPKRRV